MNTEVIALINLLDDPDTNVFEAVKTKLISYGSNVIPLLEQHSELHQEIFVQQRIEFVITQMQWQLLLQDLENWKSKSEPSLLDGAILLAKINYPDIEKEKIYERFEKISKDVWIELNNYLTPLEKINVITNIVFKFHQYSGVEINTQKANEFLLPHLLQHKKGNSFSITILYATLCLILDVPVCILQFPKQLILGFLDVHQDYTIADENNFDKIKFFIDPVFGNAISHNDIEIFFSKINMPMVNKYFTPLTSLQTIQFLIKELQQCYTTPEQNDKYLFLTKMLQKIN